ncbi:hypothetical protein VMCG_07002 [Cytospora schulzeri]|uniref:Uncharacterized protein n=1 Tax=Cytospora schulzeri TaxID=448051 RepID=A0A423W3W5_9PEZI|nr:hypothetical protein VMCG_07002 [Valsa malicola]
MAAPQPSNIDAYTQPDNPVTKEPLEKKAAAQNDSKATSRTAHAVPSEHAGEGTFSSLGRGVQGGDPADATEARHTSRGGAGEKTENENVDAEQMATLGEGKVADAVERKSGMQKAPGDAEVKIDDFSSDLDKKKAEQAEAREEIKQDRKAGVDVDGGAGARAAGTEDNTSV